jgi:hypothetical protein
MFTEPACVIIAGEERVNDIGDDGDDIGEQCVKSNSDEGAVEEKHTKIVIHFAHKSQPRKPSTARESQ